MAGKLLPWLLFLLLVHLVVSENLYAVLGIHKSASNQDIKKAYKELAREWHPDKNTDPSATDRFTKINEAYETLGNKKKRSDYDNFGYTSAQEQQPRGQQRGHHGFHQHPFDDFFGGGGGPFGGGGQRESGASMEKFLINLRTYESKMAPGSHYSPCFIYFYSDFCFNCMRLEPIIFKFMTEMESIGMCVGAVHLRRSPGLANHLRIHQAPYMLGVVAGRISYFTDSSISFHLLKEFVKNLFPTNTMEKVNDDNIEVFLSGWSDNRVRAIFFSSKEAPSLRFIAPAYAHRERVAFGYVYTGAPNIIKLLRNYSVNKHRESLIMWNENTQQASASISMQQLVRSTVDEVITNHRYLQLPRLSSQQVFDELCPQQAKVKRRRLCVALICHSSQHSAAMAAFREFAQSAPWASERVRFTYMYEDVQQGFVKALKKGNRTQTDFLEVVIMWQTDKRKLSYEFVEHGWSLEDEYAPKSRRELERRLTQVLQGDDLLPYRATVPEIYNEHMLSLMTRIFYKFVDWYDRMYYFIMGHDGMTILTAVGVVFFIVMMTMSMSKMNTQEKEKVDRDRARSEAKAQSRPPSCSTDSQTIHLYELRYQTFPNLVKNADTGLTITLLVDEDSKVKLMTTFAKIMQPYSRYSALTFAFLQLEYHLEWYRALLELTLDNKVSLDKINNRNCIGSVLAINGYRKCYYMYHPKRARKWMRKEHGRNITKSAGFGASDSDNTSSEDEAVSREENVMFEEELLGGLSIWMDRVFDGSVKKVRLPHWPGMTE